MPLEIEFETALSSDDPAKALRIMVSNFAAQGLDSPAILARFEAARAQLRSLDREADEDVVMDTMDCLVGWCSPTMILPERQEPEIPLGSGADEAAKKAQV